MIINSFDDKSPAIINPWEVIQPILGFPEIAVVAFGRRFIDKLIELFNPPEIYVLKACGPYPVYEVTFEGVRMAVYGSSLGGPAAAGFQEDMTALGSKKFLYFGSCGVLDCSLQEMSFILPTAAYRDEGTSYHYAPASEFIDVPTTPRLAEIFDELGLPYVCGKTWTTDALFRETRNNMQKRREAGCIAVEMECASIMAAAQFRGIEAYQILYAADNLDATEWDARILGHFPEDQSEKLLRIALEAAKRI